MMPEDERGGPFGTCQWGMIMNVEEIEKEIRDLESRIAHMKEAKPAHDHRGIYERTLFELEETLAEKRRTLQESGQSG